MIAASQIAFVPCAGQSAKRKEPLSAKRDGLRLNAGNSENGGAGYLNDNDRSNRNDNLGARLAFVFSSRKRFTPPVRHFGDLPKRLGKKEIIRFLDKIALHGEARENGGYLRLRYRLDERAVF